jgi:glyoxylase-like metal-dependent hydrolase (beta-lactamase superfamily II)
MPIAQRARCEVWIHPAYTMHVKPELAGQVEAARASGVPEEPLRAWAQRQQERHYIAGELKSDRDLVPGVVIKTDLGDWHVVETPGHAPSHVVLHQRERRLLISGDHLLGRVSQYFDVGYTPDPVGEFLHSLEVVEPLDVRLVLAGHARPFTDMAAHIRANRELVDQQLAAVRAVLREAPRTAYDVARTVYSERWSEELAPWLMTQTLAWLIHLEALGEAVRRTGESTESWLLD